MTDDGLDDEEDGEALIVLLSIPTLLGQWSVNPFEVTVWDGTYGPITRQEVAEAIADGTHATVATEPYDQRTLRGDDPGARVYHARRIAHLVVNGWSDPIQVDLGIPAMAYTPDWPIQDGHHRLAAAIYRGDTSIVAEAGGQIDWIESFVHGG